MPARARVPVSRVPTGSARAVPKPRMAAPSLGAPPLAGGGALPLPSPPMGRMGDKSKGKAPTTSKRGGKQ